jgi:hypothetical protein
MVENRDFRHELKFTLPDRLEGSLKNWITCHSNAFYVQYPPRQVNNIYFDSYEYAFREDHLNGLFQREKLRFRWYGDSWKTNQGQLELKFKRGEIGGKKVEWVQQTVDLTKHSWNQVESLLAENSVFFSNWIHATHPVMVNRYQREYFTSSDGIVRITVDTGHIVYDQTFGISPNLIFSKPLDDLVIIEVKASVGEEKRISSVVSELPLYATQFSKYLSGVEM